MSRKRRVFNRDFKLMVVRRMLAGENVSALAREVNVLRKDIYLWRDRFRSGGAEALRERGRPRKPRVGVTGAPEKAIEALLEIEVARQRITTLERKVGQQQLELDFFGKPCGRSRKHAGRATGLA
jgi:transposase